MAPWCHCDDNLSSSIMQSMKGTYQMSKSRILCLAAALFAGSAFADSTITINEVMAKNTTKLATASGVKGIDWVELRNSGSQPVDLSGWYLGNDPTKKTTKWPVIEGSCVVPANGYKIVWCDGDGACTSWAADEAHVACNISTDAGKHTMFLASAADTAAIVTQVPLREGLEDISYGYASSTDDYRYFTTPTPGAANAAAGRTGFTPKVAFSVPHGYKDAPFQLTLSCPEKPGAQIYYTLNGRQPTVGGSGSTLYTGPITISQTTVVRAAVPDADSLRQNDTFASYLFVADILTQTAATRPEGFPSGSMLNRRGEQQQIGYGMRAASKLGDVDAATATARLYNGFTNGIRTVSLVFDPDDLFDKDKGIYVNAKEEGREWERPTMAEQIYPVDTNDEFSVSCGISIRGAFSRMGTYKKHAFRLFFRSEYGMNSLNHPLFGDEGPQSFGKIDLRCDQNSSWANGKADTTLIQELWVRDTQRDMGQPYNKSRYYHLFLNGCYWGIYQTEERVDQRYCADTIGGEEDNFDVVRTSNTGGQNYTTGIVEGDTTAWSNFWHITMKEGYGSKYPDNYYRVQGLNPDGTRNPDYPIYLNVTNLICYMLTAHYTIDTDGPVNSATKKQNNVIGYRNRVDGEADFDGFIWNRHDGENALFHPLGKTLNQLLTDIIRLGTRDYGRTALEDFGPSMLNWELCQNAEYRRTFVDLVQKMIISPNGAMAPKASKARYRARMAEIDDAVMAELARWGGGANYERNKSWITACENDLSFFDQRTPYLLQAYRDDKIKWFPSIDAAKVLDASSVELGDGDKRAVGDRVYLTGSNVGTVYYTTDGSDPCLRDGSVSDKALVYSGTSTSGGLVVPAQGLKIMARIKTSTEWSALSEVAIVTEESGTEPTKTVFTGDYDAPVVFDADDSVILSNANFKAGITVADGVTAKLKAATNTVNTVKSIDAAGAEVRFTGEGTVKLEGTDTLATVSNLVVKSGVLQVKSTGVSVTKTPVINVLGFVEQTGGVIDMDLGFASANQVYGLYLANKDPKGADGKALGLVYARFDGGTFNAVVGATKSSAVYVDKGSVEATFKGGQVLDVVLKGTEPRFISAAGDISFKNCQANVTAGSSVSGARAFKSDKRITFGDVDGHFVANLTGPDAEVFSAADKIKIDAGTFELVASDDCFSAMTNITVNGGLVYAVSTGNDVFDSNGDMELNGGTILAFATAEGHEAFDVDPEQTESGASVHQLRINGGTIFATGGKTADWPNNLVATCDIYAAEDLDASAYSGKYVSVNSTVGVKTTVKFPVFPQAKCAVLATCPYMAGGLSVSSAAPAAGSQGFHDLYVEGLVETNQDQLRFCEIYGSTADGMTGDTGEYIVLTNISDKVVQLAGLKVNVEKLADYDKSGEAASKCLFTLTGGEVPAYGSVRLDQATYWNGEKKKITNGDIYVALTDSTGAVVQFGKASFDNAKYPGVDGEGASLIAISFDTQLKDNADCWVSSAGPATDPEQPGTDPEQPGTEGDGHDGVQLWANGPYWATVNCGASEPTEAGYYYFGGDDTVGYMVKDGALKGDLVQVASADDTWGDGWRKPTTAEATAMKEKCRVVSTGTSASGQPYVVIAGTTSGYTDKTITIPLAGYGNGKHVTDANRWGTFGKYWTSDTGSAYRLCFTSTAIELNTGGYGTEHGNYYTVRLVSDSQSSGGGTSHTHAWGTPTYTWSADNTSCTATRSCSGCTQKDTKTVSATYAVVTAATASADGLGRWTATFASPFATQTKDVTIPKSGSSDPVTPSDPVIPSDGSTGVQLWANGPYWATQNVGASGETDAGKFFMWGATTGYSTGDSNIPFGVEANCATSGKSLDQLKSGGYVDSEGNLAKSYDAAYMTMGGTWRMPTYAEWQALTKNCTFAWDDSKKVLVVTGKDAYANAQIYLPCPGYWNRNSSTGAVTLGNQNFCSYYYSSTPVSENGNTAQAYAVTVQKGGAYDGQKMYRYNGYCIRAVSTTNPGGGTGEDDPVPHTHTWGAPTYSWSADGKSCTATRACTGCTEKETETVTATFVTTKAATTEATGLGHYEAAFTNTAFAKQSGADVTIPKKEQQVDPGTGGGDGPTVTEGDYYVSMTGSDSNNGSSPETAFATIAHAVEVAVAGKTVCILEGTYELTDEISVAKAISIIGAGRNKTVIKPASGKVIRLFTIDGGARLEGVTLTGGRVTADSGAGAWVKNGTISWCCISNNLGGAHNKLGGGVSFSGGQGTVDHSIIVNNTNSGQGAYGAGIGGDTPTGTVTIDSCLVYGNAITGNGAGAGIGFKNSNYDLVIRNCTITGNTGKLYAGGIDKEGGAGKVVLINDLVSGNFVGTSAANLKVQNLDTANSRNCFFGLASEVTSYPVVGSLSGDPLLGSDCRLAEGSPAISAGVAYDGIGKDLDGKPFAATPTIGCYEFVEVIVPDVETWDIPGVTGGIQAIDDGQGVKSIAFKSISLADGRLTVGFEAGKVDANGQTFGLICKESLTSSETFTINVTLKDDGTGSATIGSLEGLTERKSLFVVGIGPAK